METLQQIENEFVRQFTRYPLILSRALKRAESTPNMDLEEALKSEVSGMVEGLLQALMLDHYGVPLNEEGVSVEIHDPRGEFQPRPHDLETGSMARRLAHDARNIDYKELRLASTF